MQLESLSPLLHLPPVVVNSLFQAVGHEHREATITYHVSEIFDDGVPRILNMTTDDYQCATVRFSSVLAVHADTWNGDAETGHALCRLGVRRNSFYEVHGSEWIKGIQGYLPEGHPPPSLKHYALAFRTRIIQVAAASYQVSVARQSLGTASL